MSNETLGSSVEINSSAMSEQPSKKHLKIMANVIEKNFPRGTLGLSDQL